MNRNVAFTVVDTQLEPERRAESAERSGGVTSVPQIFFGGEHIGGVDDLVALVSSNKLETRLEQLLLVKPQGDALIVGTPPEMHDAAHAWRDAVFSEPAMNERVRLISLTLRLATRLGLSAAANKHTVGRDEVVVALRKEPTLATSPAALEEEIRNLEACGALVSAGSGSGRSMRFCCADRAMALNEVAAPLTPYPGRADVATLTGWLNGASAALLDAHVDADGLVDYNKLLATEDWAAFLALAAELQSSDASALAELAQPVASAFWINMYNTMIIHGVAAFGPMPAQSLAKRYKFFKGNIIKYNFGRLKTVQVSGLRALDSIACVLSIDEIENGVLRRQPKYFNSGDPPDLRLTIAKAIQKADCRVHFALNCGSASCPPIAAYSSDPEVLEQELEQATDHFVGEPKNVTHDGEKLQICKLFSWYAQDFGGKERLAEWVLQRPTALSSAGDPELRGTLFAQAQAGEVKVGFLPYNWSLNSKYALEQDDGGSASCSLM